MSKGKHSEAEMIGALKQAACFAGGRRGARESQAGFSGVSRSGTGGAEKSAQEAGGRGFAETTTDGGEPGMGGGFRT